MKPSGMARRCLEVDEMVEVDMFHRFQCVARTVASWASAIVRSTELMYS